MVNWRCNAFYDQWERSEEYIREDKVEQYLINKDISSLYLDFMNKCLAHDISERFTEEEISTHCFILDKVSTMNIQPIKRRKIYINYSHTIKFARNTLTSAIAIIGKTSL